MSKKQCAQHPENEELMKNLVSVPEFCPATQIGKAYKAVLRIFEEEFRESCVTSTQFSTLVHVSLLGEPGGSELAQKLGSDPSTVSRVLDTLEAKGMVTSRPGSDRRTHRYSLTDQGINAISDGLASWERAKSRVLAEVDTDVWKNTLKTLHVVGEAS